MRRNSQDHILLVGYIDVTNGVGIGTDRQQRETPTKEWMGWICDLNLSYLFYQWVVEGGINLMDRSTTSTPGSDSPVPKVILFASSVTGNVGGTKPGDRTTLDKWYPFKDSLTLQEETEGGC